MKNNTTISAPRDLASFYNGPIVEDDRTKVYWAAIEENAEKNLKHLVTITADNDELRNAYFWGLVFALSAVSFPYSRKESKFFKNEEIRTTTALAIQAIGADMAENGQFKQSPGYGRLTQYWGLPCMLMANTLIGPDWDSDTQDSIHTILLKASEFLNSQPDMSANNRSATYAAAMAMAACAFGRPDFMATATTVIEHATRNFSEGGIFAPEGQCIEDDGGPDANYTPGTIGGCYGYWLHSGDDRMEEPMWKMMKWYCRWTSDEGCYFHASACRKLKDIDWRHHCVGALCERFAEREPWLYTRYDELARLHGGHSASPAILLEHKKDYPETTELPDWLAEYDSLCYNGMGARTGYVYYRLIGTRSYRTNLVIRGAHPLNGLQEWQMRGEPLLIFPSKGGGHSTTLGKGFSTAHQRVVQKPAAGNSTALKPKEVNFDPPWMSVHRGLVWEMYTWTPDTLVQILYSESPFLETTWFINKRLIKEMPVLTDGQLSRNGMQGRILWAQGTGTIADDEDAYRLKIDVPSGVNVYVFTGASFEWLDADVSNDQVSFKDATGEYTVAWPHGISWEDGELTVTREP